MRDLSTEPRSHLRARALSGRSTAGLQAAALYGSFALIAAVLFGTLSIQPF